MTKIEWVRSEDGSQGKSWNPVTGCTKISLGCKNCYAERMARRLAGRHGYPEAPHHFDVTLRRDRLEQPLHWRKPKTIFVCSMSDLFHEDVPIHYIADVWNVMHQCPQHTFQILTKRPYPMMSILLDWDVVLPNVWLGVSVENQAAADERIPLLLQTPAAVRFVSAEPLLGPVDLPSEWSYVYPDGFACNGPMSMTMHNSSIDPDALLDWVIAGGESGPGARPMYPGWAGSIRDQCVAAGVPFFFKQWGSAKPDVLEARRWLDAGWNPDEHGHGRLLDGRQWNEMPTL